MTDDTSPRAASEAAASASGEASDQVPGRRPVPVDLRDYVRFRDEAATRVRIFATDVLTLDLWCLQPQQATEVLVFDDADVTYTVLGGRSWFVTDEGEVGLDPLGALLVPAGVAHGIDNRAPDPLVIVAAASPPDVPVDALETDAPVADLGHAVRGAPPPRWWERLRARLPWG